MLTIQSYCTYSAYGETGDNPEIDPVYPDTQAGGYKGISLHKRTTKSTNSCRKTPMRRLQAH